MKQHQQEVAAVVRSASRTSRTCSRAAARAATSASATPGIVLAQLKPRDERKHSADEIIADLRPQLAKITGHPDLPPGAAAHSPGRQACRRASTSTLQDSDTDELYQYAPLLEQKMRALRGCRT